MTDDAMYQDDDFRVQLICAHNHPEQGYNAVCILCGVLLPPKRGNEDEEINNQEKEGTG